MSRSKSKHYLIADPSLDSPAAEAYRKLRTTLDYSHQDEGIQTLMITSALSGEGKSTTAANLSMAYAQCRKKVLLIDADLRSPSQHSIFNVEQNPGISAVLNGQALLEDVLVPVLDGTLTLLPAGPLSGNPAELLTSPRMKDLLAELSGKFDLILIDTPALLTYSDAQIIAAQCDGVLLVVKPGKVKNGAALKAKESLALVKARVLGAVLSNVNRKNAGRFIY
ncbi:CpsD/CapB family tyrosine-protein kinase [Paenibacillus sp. FSL L8-0436]|uniref:CpsD/CapB family tyrosine-protein kinase n=1 Tax=Paenibacillus sp. FSL L8-0436 TaxID=2954686 RepID=UPI0031581EF0